MSKDYYKTLGVSKDASNEEIKKAYRRLAHQHHPDKKGGDEAKFKEINEAYQVLSDPQKRKQFDQFGSDFTSNAAGGFSGFSGSDFNGFSGFDFGNGFKFNFGGSRGGGFEDIFSDVFSSAFSGNSRQDEEESSSGQDIEADLTISFYEMARGAEKKIKLYKKILCAKCQGTGAKDQKQKTCSTCKGAGRVQKAMRSFLGSFVQTFTCETCQGKGKVPDKKCEKCGGDGLVNDYQEITVKIPAGIESGQTLRVRGQGQAATSGYAGDLFLNIQVEAHPTFTRKKDNILSEIKIDFTSAALGDAISLDTIDGPVKIRINPGTQTDQVYKIKDSGISGRGFFGGNGDHLVTIKIKTPENLTSRQRQLIEELKKEGL